MARLQSHLRTPRDLRVCNRRKRPGFTVCLPSRAHFADAAESLPGQRKAKMVPIACAMFIALFAWGASYFGWSDPEGKVQLALATSFILGIVSGYKAKG